jgi:hypothetical protein
MTSHAWRRLLSVWRFTTFVKTAMDVALQWCTAIETPHQPFS